MEAIISGLKCDKCHYRDDDIPFSDYPKHVNTTRCPLCGELLLTQDDYNSCLRTMAIVEKLNKINNIFKWFNPLHYWRLIFGDKRETNILHITFKNKKTIE